jgi:hypothetical protein
LGSSPNSGVFNKVAVTTQQAHTNLLSHTLDSPDQDIEPPILSNNNVQVGGINYTSATGKEVHPAITVIDQLAVSILLVESQQLLFTDQIEG